MQWAVLHGFDAIQKELLEKLPSQQALLDLLKDLLEFSCQKGFAELVKLLLADKRVDPSLNSLQIACENGHLQVVKLLLADKRVDPSTDYQFSIQVASGNGYAEIVKLLLADKRVDPSTDNQYTICYASRLGHVEVVRLLLADERVDPSSGEQYAIRKAVQNGHVEVVKLLLSDQRVITTTSEAASFHPAILPFMLLRRSFRLHLIANQHDPELSLVGSGWNSIKPLLAEIEQIESQRKVLLDFHLLPELTRLCLDYVPDLVCSHEKKISDSNCVDGHFAFTSLSTL
jgi:hypothetical protein